ncbi:MAG TPA: sigma-70 family RNA polymerase sigma factor [Gemmataceae bacterium]|jgi:RNA polymerase sigma factor (sigma-70 family)
MPGRQPNPALRYVRSVAAERAADAPDCDLLARFARRRDEAAFAALVRRHGPMVLGVCRRVLADAHDAEDAFQAAFLILCRRAARLRPRESLAGWLYCVAYRTAQKARVAAARRARHEGRAPARPAPDPLAELTVREAHDLLDRELARLPDKFRAPLVACYLEGLTRDEAARRLGWPPGVLKSRLEQARDRLRRRLGRLGLALSGALVAALFGDGPAPAAVPPGLLGSTVSTAAGSAAPAAVVALAAGVQTAMRTKVRALTALAIGLALAGAAAGVLARPSAADPPAAPAQAPPPPAAAREFRGTVSGPDGRHVAGATVIAVGDVGHGDRLMSATDADGQFTFAALPAGKTAFPSAYLVAVKDGFGSSIQLVADPPKANRADLTLPAAAAFAGVVKDTAGRPVAGADVQVGYVHRSPPRLEGRGASWGYLPPAAVRGTPAEPFFFAATDAAGRFRFPALPAGSELIFRVSAPGFAELDTGAGGPRERRYVARADAPLAELALGPEAVIRGRVVSDVPGLSPDAAVVELDGMKSLHGFRHTVKSAADGRFTAIGLPAGPIGVFLDLPPGAPATAAGDLVTTEAGKTNDVQLKVIPGVEVTGRVVLRDTNEPVPGVHLATIGLVNPAGFHWPAKPTDAEGRFAMRLPPGKVTVKVWRTPGDYRQINASFQEIEVPAGAARFEMPQPFEVGKVGVAAPAAGDRPAAAGPLPVAAERQAAATVRRLGGWYELDGDGHVVEVNMVYHTDAAGKRSDNHLTGSDGALRVAGQFPRLKRLLLHRGQATDEGLVALVGLTDLEELLIWDADAVTDVGAAHLGGLPKLRKVHISHGRIGDAALAVFAKMPSIRELNLQGNDFSDAGLKHLAGMARLRSLWVGMSKQTITDAGARHLAGLTGLEELDLQSARLTAVGVAALKDLTRLQRLYFDGPADGGINDAGVEPLLGMTKLQSLSLGNTRLTAAGVRRLLALPDLRDLSLTSAAIGVEAQDELRKERPGVRLRVAGSANRP